jgi:hypothetical protein
MKILRQFETQKLSVRFWAVLSLILILGLAMGIRFRLLDMPLERDEGEYAYMGQLILDGVPPYAQAANMKWPGTYFAYAGIMALFGQTTGGIHFGLILVCAATSLLLFFLAKKTLGVPGALAAVMAYNVFSLSPSTLGMAAHATHFVALFALLGTLLLLNGLEQNSRRRLFGAGILMGISVLMKQCGVFFFFFGLIWSALYCKPDWRKTLRLAGFYSLGTLVPLLLCAVILLACGVWNSFWFWTVEYAGRYATTVPILAGIEICIASLRLHWIFAPGLCLLGMLGAVCLWHSSLHSQRKFLIFFTCFSFLAVCPGLYFRQHYYLVFLPAFSLLIGAVVKTASEWMQKTRFKKLSYLPLVLALMASGWSVWVLHYILFTDSPETVIKRVYNGNPFVESYEMGKLLKEKTPSNARIGILGSEPEICFYAHRRMATTAMYMYPLIERQSFAKQMRENMMRELEGHPPEFIVCVDFALSWVGSAEDALEIMDWFSRDIAPKYDLIGAILVTPGKETHYIYSQTPIKASMLNSTSSLLLYRIKQLDSSREVKPPISEQIGNTSPRAKSD